MNLQKWVNSYARVRHDSSMHVRHTAVTTVNTTCDSTPCNNQDIADNAAAFNSKHLVVVSTGCLYLISSAADDHAAANCL